MIKFKSLLSPNYNFIKINCRNKVKVIKMPSSEPSLVDRIRKELEDTDDIETVQSKNVMKHFFEPTYLEQMKPSTPFYPLLNIKLRCYDFVILENFARYVQKTCKKIGIQLNNFWPLPHQAIQYNVLKDKETTIDQTFTIPIYDRNIQIKNVKACTLPLILQLLEYSKPKGVMISVTKHKKSDDEEKYIPDLLLAEQKQELLTYSQPLTVLQEKKLV